MQWYSWCVIAFAALSIFLHFRLREEKPVSEWEKYNLSDKALRLIRGTNESIDSKLIDEEFLSKQDKVGYLRLYAKFADICPIPALDVLIAGTRYRYVFLRSNLQPKNLTEAHVKLFAQFNSLDNTGWSILGDEMSQKRHKQLQKTTFYALDHLGPLGDRMFAVVRDRGVVDLKSVKKLAKDMEAAPVEALSEGML